MEKYHQTAYSTNVYLTLGPLARQLTRHTQETVNGAQGVRVECVFRKKPKKTKAEAGSSASKEKGVQKPLSKVKAGKRKRAASLSEGEDDDQIVIVSDEEDEDNKEGRAYRDRAANPYEGSEDDDDEIIDDWSHTMRDDPPVKRQRRKSAVINQLDGFVGTLIRENNKEVLVLSD